MLDVECAARLSSDFKDKNPYAFTGCTSRQSKGPIIQCFNDADIPLKASMFGDKKQTSVGFVVIDCKVDGYTRVPYACGPGDKYKVCVCQSLSISGTAPVSASLRNGITILLSIWSWW